MGSGKTRKAIEMMNESDKRFIYITPFLTEVERIKREVKSKKFYEPIQIGKGKLSSLKNMIKEGKNIVSTHALFSTADEELMGLLKLNDYTLILDEVMEVITQVFVSNDDLKMLIRDNKIIINDNCNVSWNENDKNYNGDFEYIKIMAEHDRLIMGNGNLMLWMFPVDVFKCFDEVYVLTYMFNGQIMKYYYDLYNIKYEYMSVRKHNNDVFEYVDYEDNKKSVIDKIIICKDEKLNSIGKGKYSLSYSWYNKSHESYLEVLRNNITNFFRNKMKAKSKEILWTTFLGEDEKWRKKIQNAGYQSKRCFAPINSRATNEYSDRKYVSYVVNRFMNPYLKNFFINRGIKVDEDIFALSEMLQFIFRSAIRKDENIHIYMPSKRMRDLLEDWIKK